MITPKNVFIEKVMLIMCRHCSRRIRIEKRLKEELGEDQFDFERHEHVDKIMLEEK